MRRLPAGLSSLVAAATLAMAGAGCRDGRLPLLQIPQLQEAGELTEYGGDRIRAGEACQKSNATLDGYLGCMQAAGYVFIARENVYPSTECWSMRDAADPRRLPPSYCFHRSDAGPAVR